VSRGFLSHAWMGLRTIRVERRASPGAIRIFFLPLIRIKCRSCRADGGDRGGATARYRNGIHLPPPRSRSRPPAPTRRSLLRQGFHSKSQGVGYTPTFPLIAPKAAAHGGIRRASEWAVKAFVAAQRPALRAREFARRMSTGLSIR
jgi:hypothetical protein